MAFARKFSTTRARHDEVSYGDGKIEEDNIRQRNELKGQLGDEVKFRLVSE